MNKKYLLFLLILVFVISGCATRTRIGALIPAHQLSNQRSGEEVWLHVTKISTASIESQLNNALKACSDETKKDIKAEFFPLAPLAAMGIGMAVDYVKSELQEEAKNYEASYGAKAWLTTKDLQGISIAKSMLLNCIRKKTEERNSLNKEKAELSTDVEKLKKAGKKYSIKISSLNQKITELEQRIKSIEIPSELVSDLNLTPDSDIIDKLDSDVIILVSRWVDESVFQGSPPSEKDYEEVKGIIKQLTVLDKGNKKRQIIPSEGSTKFFDKEKDFDDATAGKKLAFAYALSLHLADSEKENSPFLVKPRFKWQWLSKAKVVNFNLAMPLALPASIFLQTGSELDYNIRLSIDFLASLKDKENGIPIPQMTFLGLKDAIAGPAKHDLSGSTQYINYFKGKTAPIIGWMAIPGYPSFDSTGYFSLQLTVNESDPSNVKKTILKGSDYLEANRDNIINRLNPF